MQFLLLHKNPNRYLLGSGIIKSLYLLLLGHIQYFVLQFES
jgi:hypothetical protein